MSSAVSSDDESFVVLGTSPSNSSIVDDYHDSHVTQERMPSATRMPTNNLPSTINLMEISSQTEPFQSFHQSKTIDNGVTSSSSSSNLSQILLNGNVVKENTSPLPIPAVVSTLKELSLASSSSSSASSSNAGAAAAMNMSTSMTNCSYSNGFMTNTNNNGIIRQSIYDQFPSLRIAQPNAEDIAKLQTVIGENIDLKENLQKTNLAMRQHFAMINKWQKNVKSVRDNQLIELDQNKETIQKLNEQISQLKHDLSMKNESIELHQDIVSEKIFKLESEINKQSEQIETMNTQIIQLQTELNDNKLLIERNESAATIEREKLMDEIEQYRSMIEIMNAQIDRLEKSSYQMIGTSLLTSQQDSILKSQSNEELLVKLAAYEKLFTENMNDSKIIKENVETIDESSMEIVSSNDEPSIRNVSHMKMMAENVAASKKENIQIYENIAANNTVDSATPKLNDQMITVAEYHVMVKQLKQEISKLLAENVELTDMKKIYTDQLDCLQVNLTSVTEEAIDFRAKLHEAESMNISLQKELSHTKSTINEPKQQSSDNDAIKNLAQLEDENKNLQSQLNELQSLMQPKDSIIEQLTAELKTNNENIECVHAIYTSTTDLLDHANKKVTSLENDKRSLENLLAQRNDTITEMENITEMLRKEIFANEQQKLLNENQNSTIIDELRNEVTVLKSKENEKIERFQAELAELTEHINGQNFKVSQLQSANDGLENVLKTSSATISNLREEANLLREQMELYRIDFEAEKKSRLDIQSEREEILSDLKLLQKRNQQLFDDAKKRNAFVGTTTTSATNTTDINGGPSTNINAAASGAIPKNSSASSSSNNDETYSCVYCSATYTNLQLLLKHINICNKN